MQGSISLTASENFLKRNQNRTLEENYDAQPASIALYKEQRHRGRARLDHGGLRLQLRGRHADATHPRHRRADLRARGRARLEIKELSLADTMAWATPATIKRLVGAVRDKYPDLELALHLHDTRGMGIANAYAGLEMGVAISMRAVAGLGGCPFAAHKGAAGNVCTEDLVFMCEEMGIETGIDLDKLIECAQPRRGHRRPPAARLGQGRRQPRRPPRPDPRGPGGVALVSQTSRVAKNKDRKRGLYFTPVTLGASPSLLIWLFWPWPS